MTAAVNTDTAYKEALTSLYFLMICADKIIDTQELEMGRIMRNVESIDQKEFYSRIDEYSNHDNRVTYNKCLSVLQQCNEEEKIRCMAWMKVIAFSDGTMASREWDLYQHICNNELGLNLNEILEVQKKIKKVID
jgi:uncharacterized tellurite resistance protein B-like protein